MVRLPARAPLSVYLNARLVGRLRRLASGAQSDENGHPFRSKAATFSAV